MREAEGEKLLGEDKRDKKQTEEPLLTSIDGVLGA